MSHLKALALPLGLAVAAGAAHWTALHLERSKLQPMQYLVYSRDIGPNEQLKEQDFSIFIVASDKKIPGALGPSHLPHLVNASTSMRIPKGTIALAGYIQTETRSLPTKDTPTQSSTGKLVRKDGLK